MCIPQVWRRLHCHDENQTPKDDLLPDLGPVERFFQGNFPGSVRRRGSTATCCSSGSPPPGQGLPAARLAQGQPAHRGVLGHADHPGPGKVGGAQLGKSLGCAAPLGWDLHEEQGRAQVPSSPCPLGQTWKIRNGFLRVFQSSTDFTDFFLPHSTTMCFLLPSLWGWPLLSFQIALLMLNLNTIECTYLKCTVP